MNVNMDGLSPDLLLGNFIAALHRRGLALGAGADEFETGFKYHVIDYLSTTSNVSEGSRQR